jgi:general secretion pathway protein M
MKAWWDRLNTRERWMVSGGAALILAMILYALIWQPFQTGLERLRQTVAEQRKDLAWMRQAALEVKRLNNASAGPARQLPQAGQRSLLTLVDQTAKTAGLGNAVKRVEPQGNDRLTVQLEQVSFDELIRWLGTLERDHGIEIVNATVDRQAESGRVNARLILQEITS